MLPCPISAVIVVAITSNLHLADAPINVSQILTWFNASLMRIAW
ncbi:MAG: hypothetical protein ACLFQP_11495 [Halothece sp.]